jgi:GH15 family glucan-1,4-alpha-glucosidase
MLSLKDYSLIGNSRAAALVSKHGSIDWCCLPEFHAPALFSAILDQNKGGLFSISPVETYQSLQQYVPKTNVLQTVFKTGTFPRPRNTADFTMYRTSSHKDAI